MQQDPSTGDDRGLPIMSRDVAEVWATHGCAQPQTPTVRTEQPSSSDAIDSAEFMSSRDRVTPTAALRFVYRVLGCFCFNRISVIGKEGVPSQGAVLYLGLHRNGAIDGIPYIHAAPRAAYLVSAQLHRSALGRWLFRGIAVARRKDRERGIGADNAEATRQCVSQLMAGGAVFMMPEGTSSLGPRHLPFKPGAAAIITRAVRDGAPLIVVPVAVQYERAWEWQSRVEVVMGKPFGLSRADVENSDAVAQKITEGLESTGINVRSDEELALIERLALAASLQSHRPYAECLKHFESAVSSNLRSCDALLQRTAQSTGARRYQGLPLIPRGSVVPGLLAWLGMAPLMLAFLVVNAPSLVAGFAASRKLPDDKNVIAFWRTLVAAPAALLWGLVVTGTLVAKGHAGFAGMYWALSAAGVRAFRWFRQRSVEVYNGVFAQAVRAPMNVLSTELQQSLDGVYV